MEFPGTDAEEHGEIALRFGGLPFKRTGVPDVLELCFGSRRVLTRFSTKPTEDVSSFLFTSGFHEPTWGFRHEPNDGEEAYKRYDLESDGKSPDER